MSFRRAVVWGIWLASASLQAQTDPGWWSSGLIRAETANNYGPLTLGQLMNFADQARIHLDTEAGAAGGAGPEIEDMVAAWPDHSPQAYSPANLGQLKAIADKFYARLDALGFDYKTQMVNDQQSAASRWSGTPSRPWSVNGASDSNYTIANIGQAKMLFSWDLTKGLLHAVSATMTTDEDTAGTITLCSFGAGTGATTYQILANPTHGTAVLNGSVVTYSPNAHYNGPDSFTFKATKGGPPSTGTISIVVNPVDDAPEVNVGGARTVTLPGTLSLSATIQDIDTAANAITQTWIKVSGPGEVTFSDASILTPTASFSAPGAYVLRLIASDAHSVRSDSLQVIVNAAGAIIPAVTLTGISSPLTFGTPVLLQAAVNVAGGATITKVEFYEGSRKIGEATVPVSGKYQLTWTPPRLGVYNLSAVATTSTGAKGSSAGVMVARVQEGNWFVSGGAGNEGYSGTGGIGGASTGATTGMSSSTYAPGSGANGGGGAAGAGGDGTGSLGSDSKDSDGDGTVDAADSYPQDPRRTEDVPVKNYIVIDLSGDVPGMNDIDRVAIGDDGQAAFSFWSSNTDYQVGLWKDGAVLADSPKTTGSSWLRPNGHDDNGDETWTEVDLVNDGQNTTAINSQGSVAMSEGASWTYGVTLPYKRDTEAWVNGVPAYMTDDGGITWDGGSDVFSGAVSGHALWTAPLQIPVGESTAFVSPYHYFSRSGRMITQAFAGGRTWYLSGEDGWTSIISSNNLGDGYPSYDAIALNDDGSVLFFGSPSADLSHSQLLYYGNGIFEDIRLKVPTIFKQQIVLDNPRKIFNDGTIIVDGESLEGPGVGALVKRKFIHDPKHPDSDDENRWPISVAHFPDGWSNGRVANEAGLPLHGQAWIDIQDSNSAGVLITAAYKTLDDTPARNFIPEVQQRLHALMLIPYEFSIYPSDPYAVQTNGAQPKAKDLTHQVSADEGSVYIQANLFVQGEDEDGNAGLQPVEDDSVIRWEIMDGSSGGGSLEELETKTKDGFAAVKLSTSHHPGDLYKVRAKLIKIKKGEKLWETDEDHPYATVESGVVEVVPGQASLITVVPSGDGQGATLPADGKSEKTITATIRDAYGNPVAGGSAIYWHVKGLGTLKDADASADIHGQAKATLVAGDVPGDQIVTVEADALSKDTTISNVPLSGSLATGAASLDMASGQATALTASFPNAKNGAVVHWYTSKGEIQNAATTISGGQATATLRANGTRLGDALVFASVGGNVRMARVTFTSSSAIKVSVQRPLLAADATADGSSSITNANGTTTSVNYRGTTNITISAPAYAGQQATVQVGVQQPALQVRFPLDSNASNSTATSTATLSGASLDPLLAQDGAASLSFPTAVASASIASTSAYQAQTGLEISAWVRPSGSLGANVLAKAGEYALAVDGSGHPTFSLTTNAGTTTVTAPATLPEKAWTLVKGKIRADGTISVSVDRMATTAAYTGGLVTTANPVVVGGSGFVGHIDGLGFDSGQSFGAPVTPSYVVTGLNASNQVTLDSQGNATIQIRGSGIAGTAAQIARRLAVDVSVTPHQTFESALTMAPKEDIARIIAADQQLAPNGLAMAAADVEELAARQVGDYVDSGQKTQAVVPMKAPTVSANAKMGYQLAVFFKDESDLTGKVEHIMSVNLANLSPEANAMLTARCTAAYQQACASGNDAEFRQYIQEHLGEFADALMKMSTEKPGAFVLTVNAVDGEKTFDEMSGVARYGGGDLVQDIGQIANDEHLQTNFIQKTFAWLDAKVDDLGNFAKWKTAAFNGAEGFLRVNLQACVADGTVTPTQAYSVGYIWGLLKTANQFSDLALDAKQTAQMFSNLVATVVRARNGDPEAIHILEGLIPTVNTYREFQASYDQWQAGNYFDSGVTGMTATISGVADATIIAGLAAKMAGYGILVRNASLQGKVSNWIGRTGETHVQNVLEATGGYERLIRLQNRSNQGIDLVGFTKEGDIVIIETKSHAHIGKPELSEAQKNLSKWVSDNVNLVIEGNGRYSHYTKEQFDSAKEIRAALDAKKPIHTVIVNVDNVLEHYPQPYIDVVAQTDKIDIKCFIWRNGKFEIADWPPKPK